MFFCGVFLIGKKILNFVEDHQMNILTKFGSNWKTSGFREEDYTVKAYG
jgi:hypothetical protein